MKLVKCDEVRYSCGYTTEKIFINIILHFYITVGDVMLDLNVLHEENKS